jgi:hypothetical protein
VKRQEVVSGLSQAADRCEAPDALVRAMPVVVVDPAIKHGGSVLGMVIDGAVGPFAQRRLDEALGFAVLVGPELQLVRMFERA